MEDSWMFRELSPPAAGLTDALKGFSEMLSAGHRVVDLATQALLGTLDSATCRDEILQTEDRIDSLERSIRRRVTIHAMAYSGTEVAVGLGLMSLVKDAERIGDYGTALFNLSQWLGTRLAGERCDDIKRLSQRTLELLELGRQAFDARDQHAAEDVIRRCTDVRDHCEAVVRQLVQGVPSDPQAVAYALAYQRLRRIASHLRNIQTALVQPLEKLDFLP